MPYEKTPSPAAVLSATYRAFGAVVARVDGRQSWLPTDCEGWAVRDLVFHCLCDAQRGLVALHTPSDRAPDCDAVAYWRDWQPDSANGSSSRMFPRVVASTFTDFRELRELYLETSAAVVEAAARANAGEPVTSQGHVLTAGDLVRTLAVEGTVHHLDLVVSLTDVPGPSKEGLGEVRRTLDGLLGHPAPASWSDEYYARVATGRVPLSDTDRNRLGTNARRFPLFG